MGGFIKRFIPPVPHTFFFTRKKGGGGEKNGRVHCCPQLCDLWERGKRGKGEIPVHGRGKEKNGKMRDTGLK